jgi:tRNA (cytidine/uridine-2'-O-)-methyltransferase
MSCSFRIVLYQPEIPANTGNIGRLCVGANAELHLIKPMRFILSDKYLKRAGLDYWPKLKFFIHENLDDFLKSVNQYNVYFCSTKGKFNYSQINFSLGDIFVFGPETQGLPEKMLNDNRDKTLKIPMNADIRSLNLSNSVAIILYEALRQTQYCFI